MLSAFEEEVTHMLTYLTNKLLVEKLSDRVVIGYQKNPAPNMLSRNLAKVVFLDITKFAFE